MHKLPLLKTPDLKANIGEFSNEIDYFTELRKEMSSYFGVKHAVLLNSATSAIHVALRLLKVGSGDKVICPTFTYVATVNPVLYEGAEPIFVDSEIGNWGMSPILLEKALTECEIKDELPKAIIIVHAYGTPASVDAIKVLASRYDIPIIEDAAGAMGSLYNGRKAGSLTDLGVVSFNNNKVISGLGGGVLLLDDDEKAEEARRMSVHEKADLPYYHHRRNGYNYQIGLMSAARVFHSLQDLDVCLNEKKNVYSQYRKSLQKEGFIFQAEVNGVFPNHWLTAVLKPDLTFERILIIVNAMNSKGIEVRPLWMPMHQQPYLQDNSVFLDRTAERISQIGLSLPSSSDLGEEQLQLVCSELKQLAS